jgi:hypothetical protein
MPAPNVRTADVARTVHHAAVLSVIAGCCTSSHDGTMRAASVARAVLAALHVAHAGGPSMHTAPGVTSTMRTATAKAEQHVTEIPYRMFSRAASRLSQRSRSSACVAG